MSTRIRLRYDSITNWNNQNPALLPGEFAVAQDGDEIIVRVGNGTPGTNNTVNWRDAPQISGAGTIIDGFDFTNLDIGDIIYWDGANGWNTASLADRLEAGTNIQLVEDEETGKVRINYFVASFNPTITLNETGATQSVKLIEVRNKYNNQDYDASTNPGGLGSTLNFTINKGSGTLDVASGSVTSTTNRNYSGSGPFLSFNDGGGPKSIEIVPIIDSNGEFGAVIGSGGFSIDSADERRDLFNVNTTSEIVAPLTQPLTDTDSITLQYGWRRFFVWSQTDYTNAADLQTAYQSNASSFNKPSTTDTIANTPTNVTTSTLTSPSGAGIWYLYYMHSSNGTGANDTFKWNPRFRSSTDDIETFTEITTGASGIAYDTYQNNTINNPEKEYRVWKFSNPVNPNTPLQFKID